MDLIEEEFTRKQERAIEMIAQRVLAKALGNHVENFGGDPKSQELTTMQRWWRSSEYVDVFKYEGPAHDQTARMGQARMMGPRAFRREIADVIVATLQKALESTTCAPITPQVQQIRMALRTLIAKEQAT